MDLPPAPPSLPPSLHSTGPPSPAQPHLTCPDPFLIHGPEPTYTVLPKTHRRQQVDPVLATEQAAALHKAGVQKFIGVANEVFPDILGRQPRGQIQVR